MRTTSFLRLSIAAMAAALATPGIAADLGRGFSVNGGATLVTDYRFRGISQTDKRFAVQGTFTLSHASGFYATVWGSSIDDYIANGSDQEIDLVGGWSKTWGGTKLDMGVLYYYYPGSHGANTDFVEPYVSVAETLGPVTAKVTANYAPKAKALTVGNGKEDNLYLAGDLSAGIPNTGFALSAHLGHSFGPSYLVPSGDGYTDWNVGATYTAGPLTFGLSYVDADDDFIVDGRNETKGGLVGSVGVAF